MMYMTQQIYDKEILIFCPSRGRAKTCTTHKVLPSVVYWVGEDEYEEYVENVGEDRVRCVPDGIQVPPSGKCRTLNYLLDNYKNENNIILFTDDDIFKIVRIDFLEKRKTKEVKEDELKILLCKLGFIAKNIGAKIGGFSCLSSGDILQMGLSNRFRLTQKNILMGKLLLYMRMMGLDIKKIFI